MSNTDPVTDLLTILGHHEEELPVSVQEAFAKCRDMVQSPLGTFAANIGRQLLRDQARIDELEERVGSLQGQMRRSETGWCLPREVEEGPLPVPRLEMRIEVQQWGWTWTYMLVRRHFLGNLEGLMLGSTEVRTARHPDASKSLDLPIRDGVHIAFDARFLSLPAFVTLGDRAERVEPLDDARYFQALPKKP